MLSDPVAARPAILTMLCFLTWANGNHRDHVSRVYSMYWQLLDVRRESPSSLAKTARNKPGTSPAACGPLGWMCRAKLSHVSTEGGNSLTNKSAPKRQECIHEPTFARGLRCLRHACPESINCRPVSASDGPRVGGDGTRDGRRRPPAAESGLATDPGVARLCCDGGGGGVCFSPQQAGGKDR